MSSAPTSDSASSRGITTVGILIVDDQHAVREGVARLLVSAPISLRTIRKAGTCEEARSIAASMRPEVVVLDVDLAGQDGLALIGHLGPAAQVVVLTCHGDAATRARAKRRGAVAFIEKQQPAAELIKAIVEIINLRSGGDKTPGWGGTSSHSPCAAPSDASVPRRP